MCLISNSCTHSLAAETISTKVEIHGVFPSLVAMLRSKSVHSRLTAAVALIDLSLNGTLALKLDSMTMYSVVVLFPLFAQFALN